MVCVCGTEELLLVAKLRVVGDGVDAIDVASAEEVASWAETLVICTIVKCSISQLGFLRIFASIILAACFALGICIRAVV